MREKALIWWSNLTPAGKIAAYQSWKNSISKKNKQFAEWTFEMIDFSSSAIEKVYTDTMEREFVYKDDLGRICETLLDHPLMVENVTIGVRYKLLDAIQDIVKDYKVKYLKKK